MAGRPGVAVRSCAACQGAAGTRVRLDHGDGRRRGGGQTRPGPGGQLAAGPREGPPFVRRETGPRKAWVRFRWRGALPAAAPAAGPSGGGGMDGGPEQRGARHAGKRRGGRREVSGRWRWHGVRHRRTPKGEPPRLVADRRGGGKRATSQTAPQVPKFWPEHPGKQTVPPFMRGTPGS